MKRTLLTLALFTVACSHAAVAQTTLHVPSDYPNIHFAASVASPGDTILVQPGLYIGGATIHVDNLTILSAGDADNTILEAHAPTVAVLLIERADSVVVRGFTLTGGRPGILINNSFGSEFTDLLISGNDIGIWIFANPITALFERVVVKDNSSVGIFLEDGGRAQVAAVVFQDVVVWNNHTTQAQRLGGKSWAGGIFLGGGNLVFRDTWIIGNTITVESGDRPFAGGVTVSGARALFEDCVIANNHLVSSATAGSGARRGNAGGILFYGSEQTMRRVTIAYNSAKGQEGWAQGGGMSVFAIPSHTEALLQDITFVGNRGQFGGGLFVLNSPFEIVSSNFSDNGQAIFVEGMAPVSAEASWWGHATGPYHSSQNQAGRGDSVHQFVDVTPFSTQPNIDAPPIPVRGLSLRQKDEQSVTLSWLPSALSDLAGYKISYTSSPDSLFPNRSTDLLSETEHSITGLDSDSTYYFYGVTVDTDGNESWYSRALVVDMSVAYVSVEETPIVPIGPVVLEGNSPNPFHSTTTIEYSLRESGHVHLAVFDALGREISVLVDERQSAGKHQVPFVANELPSGLYFYRIRFEGREDVYPMVLIR